MSDRYTVIPGTPCNLMQEGDNFWTEPYYVACEDCGALVVNADKSKMMHDAFHLELMALSGLELKRRLEKTTEHDKENNV